jgi:ABC-type transport system involved in multi-copper enzyme maturation permease subunit
MMTGTAMKRQIVSELRKLVTTRSVYTMLAALLAVVAFGVVVIVAETAAGSLAFPLEHQPFLHVSMTIAPLFGLLLGLRSFTDEFRHGSIVPTLLADPNRVRVLGAKVVVVVVAAAALTLAAVALSLAIGVPMLGAKGVSVTWSLGPLAATVGRMLAASAVWGALGVGVGLAVKHQVAAIAGSLIWLLAAEGLLSGLIPDVARFFPGSAGFAFVGLNPGSGLTPALGAVLLLGYAAVAVVAGAGLMQRRDIA